MIIGLSGYAKSGKDEVAKIIQELQTGWQVKKFSGVLKKVASLLTGIPQDKFEDQEFKQSYLGSEWSTPTMTPLNTIPVFESVQFMQMMSVREFLQKLGTDAIRDGLHPNAWVNAAMVGYHTEEKESRYGEYFKIVSGPCNWIFTDCRFPNEAQAIKDRGGVIIRIDRPGVGPVNDHPSETALDDWDFDYKILNASDLESLKQTVSVILNKIA